VGGCSGAWASSLFVMMGRSFPNRCGFVYSEHTSMATCSAGTPSATSPSTSHSAPAGRKSRLPTDFVPGGGCWIDRAAEGESPCDERRLP
jgi:hypothetical protein